MKQTILLITQIGIVCGLLSLNCHGEEPQKPEEPKELTQLRDQWLKLRTSAVSPLDKKYSQGLEDLKTRFTKAGNLEAALAVNAELKLTRDAGISLGADSSSTSQTKSKIPVGTWKSLWHHRRFDTFAIDENGNYKQVEADREVDDKTYKMRLLDSGWIIKLEKHDCLNRVTIAGDKLFLEQWYPIKLFEEGAPPTAFGYATKVK